MYYFFLGTLPLPVTPAELNLTINNQNKTVSLINDGEINILKLPGLSEVDFEFMIPHTQYPFAYYSGGSFLTADTVLGYLEKLKAQRTVFQFIVSRMAGSQLSFATNIKVSLESYEIAESADNGFDQTVRVTLKQYKPYSTKILETDKNGKTIVKKTRGEAVDMQLYIQAGKLYEPIVAGSVKWETSRFGEPGKLVFTVVKDDLIAFQEGARVHFSVDGVNLFYGFVFVKKRNKDHHIEVTAYDQLRYLKNKDTYVYTNKTATELLKMLAADFKLQTGSLEDTGFKIAQRVEDNTTLFDMVQNALDMTLSSTGKMYVLYDDFGRLTLKNIENMKLKTVIEEETAEDFDYTSSIDGETYNQIKLAYENGETGKREIYLVRDSDNISQWGVLQYFESIKEETNGAAKAEALLALHNRKTRNLTIKDALGDLKVRAGCSLPVILNLGDIINRSYLVCEKVTHKFEEGHHSMDLTMIGGDGFVG